MNEPTPTPSLKSIQLPFLTEPRPAPLAAGACIGEHIIRRLLASGGHGTVYEAEHRMLGRRDAIKVLHSHLTRNGEMLQRFIREAKVVNQIRHPNIVDIYDYGVLPDDSPYYVMELLGGTTLRALLRLRGRLTPGRALAYLEPVCAALDAAHKAGVVHRDLKACNIIIVDEKDPPRVKLLDFGIAKLLTPDPSTPGLTIAGERLGTPQNMAPEQIQGGLVDPRTDVYALGVLLFQMLTMRYPFESGNPMEIERMHLSAAPPRPSQYAPVDAVIDAVVLRCLEKDPARRFPDVPAFIQQLRQVVGTLEAAGAGRPAPSLVSVVAVHFDLELDDAAHEDDTALLTIADLLDCAEREMIGAGFLVPIQTGTSILGIRLLSEDTAQAWRERKEAMVFARHLHHRACEKEKPWIRVHLCVHVDQAEVRKTASGVELVGGPVARISDWLVHDPTRFALTPSAIRYG